MAHPLYIHTYIHVLIKYMLKAQSRVSKKKKKKRESSQREEPGHHMNLAQHGLLHACDMVVTEKEIVCAKKCITDFFLNYTTEVFGSKWELFLLQYRNKEPINNGTRTFIMKSETKRIS
jgi:hypothetical protein